MRASNELARRKRVSAHAAAQAAEDAQHQAQHTTLVAAKINAYQAQARGAFPGTAAQFEAAWPRILEQWQIDQARAAMDANTVRIRERIGDLL